MHGQKPGQPQMMTTVSSASSQAAAAQAAATGKQLAAAQQQPMTAPGQAASQSFAMPTPVGPQTTMAAGATYLLAANPMTGNLQE